MKKLKRIITGLPLAYLLIAPFGLLSQSVQAPVNLGTAGNYVVLSQTGITDVGPSPIVGNIGSSPITGAAVHITCAEVTGTISVVDAAGPAPCAVIAPLALGVAIGDMNTAFTNAAGRTTPDFINLGAGNITGLTLAPGLYKWGTDLLISAAGVTLSGGPNAVWIFQIAGDLTLANGGHVFLAGGASANNIFWQVGASNFGATLGTGSVMNGTILSGKQVIENTGATLNGRALAQTQVTLQSTSITTPGPLVGGVPVPGAPTVTSTVPANLAVGVPIGNALSATFSEAMNPATINATTFTLKNGVTTINGTVTYVGVTATFTPLVTLPVNSLLTATITTGAQDPAGVALPANYVWTFTTGAALDVTPPAVSSTVPVNGAVNVPIGNALSATFSEAMKPSTINSTTFTLKHGAISDAGTVSYAGVTATLTPSAALLTNTLFTATITTGAQDLSGNAMVADYTWTFTTGAVADVIPPTVSSTVPATNSIGVPAGTALSATFTEAMNPLTINTITFSLKQGVTPVAGTVNYAGVTATFTPTVSLAANLPFTATITTGVQDLSGNAMVANYVWNFTTAANVVIPVPPAVISTMPASGATAVTLSTNLVASFSTPMNPLTINTLTFTLLRGTTSVSGAVTYANNSATFRPTVNLVPNTLYTAQVSGSVSDLSGNILGSSYQWSFTTGTAGNQAVVCLANFAALAGTAITSTGATVISGDLGVTPGTSVIGFPPGTFNGTTYTGNNGNVSQAMIAVTAAFADAAGRSTGPVPVSGDLGGQTLTAGLYRSSGSLQILTGDLTLDAKGDVNAVFIFQIASTLTTGAGRRIVLSGGAQAFNVFWQVGTAAALGANSVFNGSILALQSIVLNTGASVSGRLASINGSVTLQSNVVTSPPPFIAASGIFNSASYSNAVAAGSIASVFGNNFSSSTIAAKSYPLLPSLGQTSFQVGSQAGPLFMTSCSQTNLQIPWESAGQNQASVTATVAGLVSPSQSAAIVPVSPGIYTLDQSGSGQGMVQIALTGQLAAPVAAGGFPVARGQYISIYATGLGPVSNQPATGAAALSTPLSFTLTLPTTVTIGGIPAQVTYSGLAPGFAGLYQINALVPASVSPGSAVSLVLGIGNVQSNTVTIAVQ